MEVTQSGDFLMVEGGLLIKHQLSLNLYIAFASVFACHQQDTSVIMSHHTSTYC